MYIEIIAHVLRIIVPHLLKLFPFYKKIEVVILTFFFRETLNSDSEFISFIHIHEAVLTKVFFPYLIHKIIQKLDLSKAKMIDR